MCIFFAYIYAQRASLFLIVLRGVPVAVEAVMTPYTRIQMYWERSGRICLLIPLEKAKAQF